MMLPAEQDGPADWTHKQSDLAQKLGARHEIKFSGGSTARVSFEMD